MGDIAIDLRGVDGSLWHLLDPRSGVQLAGGVKGLSVPVPTAQWSESATIAGRRRRGVAYAGRDVTMRVHVGDLHQPVRRGPDWRRLDAAWWSAVSPDAPCTVAVDAGLTDALGRPDVRTLQLWDASDDPGFGYDPAQVGSAVYDMDLQAESAWWSGPDVVRRFNYQSSGSANYYGGSTGLGPPFIIGAGSQFASASIDNPGQRPAYARYRVFAPFGSAAVGLPGQLIPLPFSQVASQQVVIDTDPRRMTIRDGAGNNLWPLVGAGLDPIFAPIPPGASVPLTIVLDQPADGAGVEVSLTPLYRRGW